MIRTQIQLDEDQASALRRLAAERGVSMAALIREGVGQVLAQRHSDAAWDAALAVVGAHRGEGDAVGHDHDRHLDAAFSS